MVIASTTRKETKAGCSEDVEISLLPFQLEASTSIARKCAEYLADPLLIKKNQILPFFQNLVAITGSGKTLILADAVEQLRSRLPVEPIVLWLSKGRVVVWQTVANLSEGGKYSRLVPGYDVKPLAECRPEHVANGERGLLLIATVAKFNQKDKEKGDRRIFQVGLDMADQSLWDLLRERRDAQGRKRPLIIVYDEGHNLSDQQTKLLMELCPEALISASATMRVPEELANVINRLRNEAKWTDKDLITTVRSADVVAAGLIKKGIMLGGYKTPMEIAVNDMLAEMKEAERAAASLGLPFRPKAIYVTTTNTVDGRSIREDMARPFSDRMARPIVIWRHLVQSGVDPSDIAVYCDLKFSSEFPPPPNFNLFAGGDSDYDRFVEGNYHHIIFNLSLQEGWDDPECSFAYIDKDMGSPSQITQVIGRVLRQPGAQHYPSADLNTAHFYIRTDEEGIFEAVLREVESQLVAEIPEVTLTVRKASKGGETSSLPPRETRTVPQASINSAAALETIQRIIRNTHDYRHDTVNTKGKGQLIRVLREVGSGDRAHEEWVEVEHSNRVTARWVFVREIQKTHPKAVNLCDIDEAKFDAFVEYSSPAAEHLREQARKVTQAYVSLSKIELHPKDKYVVGKVPVNKATMVRFSHALHEGYSDLNNLELCFAQEIDATGLTWCRNPSHGSYGIPLLDYGSTNIFYPDFLVWSEDGETIVAIDTKGDHLIHLDAYRKIFFIEKPEGGPRLVLRLVTEGEWHVKEDGQFQKVSGAHGITVWEVKNGKICTVHFPTASEAARYCVNIEPFPRWNLPSWYPCDR